MLSHYCALLFSSYLAGVEVTLACGVQASHCGGFSFCVWQAQWFWCVGLVPPQHVESSWTRGQICVPPLAGRF